MFFTTTTFLKLKMLNDMYTNNSIFIILKSKTIYIHNNLVLFDFIYPEVELSSVLITCPYQNYIICQLRLNRFHYKVQISNLIIMTICLLTDNFISETFEDVDILGGFLDHLHPLTPHLHHCTKDI